MCKFSYFAPYFVLALLEYFCRIADSDYNPSAHLLQHTLTCPATLIASNLYPLELCLIVYGYMLQFTRFALASYLRNRDG
jgi:hypothetical protein